MLTYLDALDEALGRFDGVVRSGDGYKVVCPCHEGLDPSLSISEDGAGRLLLSCPAGCRAEDILKEVGLTAAALRGDVGPAGSRRRGAAATARAEEGPDLTVRHQVYARLSELLGLSEAHRQELEARGVPPARIHTGGYATLGVIANARACKRLLEEFGAALSRVPGFDLSDPDYTRLTQPSGLLVPVRDFRGRVTACRVHATCSWNRSGWLTGMEVGGWGAVNVVHLAQDAPARWLVTEGILTAHAVAARHQQAVRGVIELTERDDWREAVPILSEAGAEEALFAFDADPTSRAAVRVTERAIAAALRGVGIAARRL